MVRLPLSPDGLTAWSCLAINATVPEKGVRAEPIVTRLKEHGISASGAEPFATTVAVPQALRLAFGGVPKDELKEVLQIVRKAVDGVSMS